MNKWEREVQRSLLDSEEDVLEALERVYRQVLAEIDEKIKGMMTDELTASRIYRIEHQRALRAQVKTALDQLHSNAYDTIDKYLSQVYKTGYIGAMYNLSRQGIPIAQPISQRAALRAIVTNSKIKGSLYETLGVDVEGLKRTIPAEIARGLASDMPYGDIARNIAARARAPLSRAKTIARTEGHRIQQAGHEDARKVAVQKGASIVKQWDATLDRHTRPSHRQMDGEIRPEGQRFSNGLRYPGDPQGPASEVVNCRCTATTRALWALDEKELEILQERAAYWGLDKAESFKAFRKKYLEVE